jgi:signal transduction histidine kinase
MSRALLVLAGFAPLLVFGGEGGAPGKRSAEGETGLPVLTTVAQMRNLSLEEAARGYPVRLKCLVVGRLIPPTFVIQDGTGTIPVFREGETNIYWPGQQIQLEGITDPGMFATRITAQRVTVTGTAPLPPPVKLTMEDLAFGKARADYGELQGIVRSTYWDEPNRRLEMHVALGTSRLEVYVFDPGETNCQWLVDASVSMRGVVSSRFNQQRQWLGARLNVTTLTNVFVEQPARPNPFDSPSFPIDKLAQAEAARPGTEYSSGHRLKTRGVVTYFVPGERLFIQEGDSGLQVETHDREPLAIGDQVEILGFPAAGVYAPILEDAIYRKTGFGTKFQPKAATARQLMNGHFEAELVTIDARLLSMMHHRGDDVVVLQADNLLFSAALRSSGWGQPSLAGLPEETQVQVTGICQAVEATERMGVDSPILSPTSVRLLLRSPYDLVVIRRRSWWTPQRLALALAGMSALGLAAAGWIWLLRRRVQTQTAIILDKAQRETILEERSRIARELHDTVEQELAGVSMQLDLVNFKLQQAPENGVTPALDLARRMVRHCQTEARHSIWELRCAALEKGDLVSALKETLQPILEGHDLQLRVEVQREARRLPSQVENDLLRMGQEAATNAVRHAHAHQITIVLDFGPESVQMTIADDGCGFNPSNPALVLSGRFGLAGMAERAAKLGGELSVDSVPGSGTRIRIVVPAKPGLREDS